MDKKKIYACLLIMTVLTLIVPEITVARDTLLSSVKESQHRETIKPKPLSSLYAGAGLGNSMNYLGSDVSQDKPFFYGSFTYGYREELYFSASASYLTVFDKIPAFAALSLSYIHDINIWLDISLSISRYQVNRYLTDTLFTHFFYGDMAAGVDWKILYTNLSLGGVFAETGSLYLQLRNSRYFETGRFLNNKAYISFDPYINLMFGTLTETVTADGTLVGVTSPIKPRKTSGGQHSSVTEFFGLMECDLGLTVGFNLGSLTVEAEPGFVLPAYENPENQSVRGFTFLVNIYYKIF